jgi:hypothetical protein
MMNHSMSKRCGKDIKIQDTSNMRKMAFDYIQANHSSKVRLKKRIEYI